MLNRVVCLYKNIKNVSWDGAYLFGAVKVDDELISFVDDYEDDLEIALENAQSNVIYSSDIKKYSNLQIKFLPPRKEYAFFARDFDDYLANFGFMYKPASEFYISSIDALYPNNSSNSTQIEAYLRIVKLYELLGTVADHSDIDNVTAHKHIFLSATGKDEFDVVYDQSIIEKLSGRLDSFEIDSAREDVFMEPHKNSKKILLKKSMSQFVIGAKEEEKFGLIIERFSDIFKSYKNNYELFLNEFSFEDERETLEQSKREYILKLNEILGGIHGKLLAVPVSLVIVAGQMKPQTEANFFLINLIILSGAFVFALLMWMLTANQLHSLIAVKTEFRGKKERLKGQLKHSLFNELCQAFEQLDDRFDHQRRMIRFVDYLVLVGFIFSFFVFEFYTKFIASFF